MVLRIMTEKEYNITFATGGLLFHETLAVAKVYERLEDWAAVREEVLGQNLLQIRTQSAARRTYQEVAGRLEMLTPEEMALLREGMVQEQRYLLWLAVCRRSLFIRDFAVELLREKYLRLDLELSYDDYDSFFYRKEEWHPELEEVADSTHKKQRQYLFKMLRQAQLLSRDNHILPALLTPRLARTVAATDPADLHIYPVSDLDIWSWLA
jgi:hypothetical protein